MKYDPIEVLNSARKAVPAVNYALGVAGIAAAAALVAAFTGNSRAAVIIVGLVFVAMVLLFVFATLVRAKSAAIRRAAEFLLWAVLLFFASFLVLTVSAFSIGEPCNWAKVVGADCRAAPPPTDPATEALKSVALLATERSSALRTATAGVQLFVSSDAAVADKLRIADALVELVEPPAVRAALDPVQLASIIAALTAIPEPQWRCPQFQPLRKTMPSVWDILNEIVSREEPYPPERKDLDLLLNKTNLQKGYVYVEFDPEKCH